MPQYIKLQVGDTTENGQIAIVDEDRLCYIVRSSSHGAMGLRTISKALLKEFVEYFEKNPEASSTDARGKLCGTSDIDKFEYGYNATLTAMAKMVLGSTNVIRLSLDPNKTLLFEPCIESKEGVNGFLDRVIPFVLEKDDNLSKLSKYFITTSGKNNIYVSKLCLGRDRNNLSDIALSNKLYINPDVCWIYNDKTYNLNREFTYSEFETFQGVFNDVYKGCFEIVVDTVEYNGAIRKRCSLFALKNTSVQSSLPPLDQPLQQIFYGAPGTGKSHTIKKTTDGVDSKFVVRTTFHPDSDYSTFVGAYKPKMEVMPRYNPQTGEQMGVEKRIVYAYTPQAFLKAYITAWQNPEQPVYLIIEEINRGNCAQIFGDLFQLLDRGDDGLSCYPIKADQDMQMHLMEVFAGNDALPENIRLGEELVLPSNLYIWATMNTSDQSLFPIDSAFKRRWEWKYIPITQGKDKETSKLMQWSIEAEGVSYDWWSFLEVMNKRVGDITSSEDKKLGFFFCKADGQGIISADKFVSKVLFYLWNDVFKDYPDNPIANLKEEGGEFTYGDFYTTNAGGDVVVREELVTRLLDALGVKVNFENENEDENENINADNTGNYTKRHLKVIYPDGTVIEHNNSTTTLLEVINYAGPARVAALDLKISGLPMVADYQLEPEGKGYATSQRLVNDGYWVMTKLSTDAKLGKLTEISNRLGLDLQVSIVEL